MCMTLIEAARAGATPTRTEARAAAARESLTVRPGGKVAARRGRGDSEREDEKGGTRRAVTDIIMMMVSDGHGTRRARASLSE
jgi:hypothetical protein